MFSPFIAAAAAAVLVGIDVVRKLHVRAIRLMVSIEFMLCLVATSASLCLFAKPNLISTHT